MFIIIKEKGNIVAGLRDISIVGVFRKGNNTEITAVGSDKTFVFAQTEDEFQALLEQLYR